MFEKLKGWLTKMIKPEDLTQIINTSPLISNKMLQEMETWERLYKGEATWLREPSLENPVKIRSLGLPVTIAKEKARMATLEMKSEITIKDTIKKEEQETNSTNDNIIKPEEDERLNWLQEQYQTKVINKLRNELEFGGALGGFVIKPYVLTKKKDGNGRIVLEIEYIKQGSYFPISYDSSGKITEAAFVQTKVTKDRVYRRVEHHKLEGTTITITNRAFVAYNTKEREEKVVNNQYVFGQEIGLGSVAEWADLEPVTTINNVDRLLFAYYKNPEANNIDPLSPLGIGWYAQAVNLIEEADRQYSRILWEYEGSELAIDIDRDALGVKKTASGISIPTQNIMQNRLFRKIDLGDEKTYEVYSPTIRDSSLFNGLNKILMRIEDVCAMSRGDLSEVVGSEARTATELKILKQRAFAANKDIQMALQKTLEDVVYILNTYATLYNIVPGSKEYEASFEWDDSILVDEDTEINQRAALLRDGIISKIEYRMWYFGETEEQAREALKKVQEEQLQEQQDQFNEGFDYDGNMEGTNPPANEGSEDE